MDSSAFLFLIVITGVFAYAFYKKRKKGTKKTEAETETGVMSVNYAASRYGQNRIVRGVTVYTALFDGDGNCGDFDVMLETALQDILDGLIRDNKKVVSISHITRSDRVIFYITY